MQANEIPLNHALLVAGVLFSLGVFGVLRRQSLLFVLLSIEIMFNAAAFVFIAAAARLGEPDGQIVFLFILAVAASEVAIGLALLLNVDRLKRTLDTSALHELKG